MMKPLHAILIGGLALGGCTAEVQTQPGYVDATYSGPATPEMVDVGDGVQVIADYQEPIFFADGFYWHSVGGRWYQARDYHRGWVEARGTVPGHIARIDHPEPVVAALASGDPEQLAPLLGNELQPAALSMKPALRRVLRAGVEAGALAGIVSGSGPTCTFLCRSASSAGDVGTELSGAGVCRTVRVASGPVHGARVVPAPT